MVPVPASPVGVKRRIEEGVVSKKPRVPRFQGPGRKLYDDDPDKFFKGKAQRLPDGPSGGLAGVREQAIQRMVDIARRAEQQTTRNQNFQRLAENQRRMRRGGAPGDVAALGKRKREPSPPPVNTLRPSPKVAVRRMQGGYRPTFTMR